MIQLALLGFIQPCCDFFRCRYGRLDVVLPKTELLLGEYLSKEVETSEFRIFKKDVIIVKCHKN